MKMNLPLHFARRYLLSKKSVNAINIISGISVLGVLVSSAALIIILSFFNGMEKLILSMYSAFTPELRIEPAEGKTFSTDTLVFAHIKEDSRVVGYSEVLQEKVLLRYNENQFIATLKGVDPDYAVDRPIDSMLYDGHFVLTHNEEEYAVIGAYIHSSLGISLQDESGWIEVFTPRKGVVNTVNPAEEFNVRAIRPSGVMIYQQQFDDMIIVPIEFAKDVLGEFEEVSAVELDLVPRVNVAVFQRDLMKQLGENYVVKNREQQNPTLYKTIRSEKWVVFFILTLTSVIAIFNIIGSLTMLVIDKKDDISILKGLGANDMLIRRIFFYEGLMISLIGCVAGLLIGLLFCLSQQYFGWLRFSQSEGLITDVYPVDIRTMDFVLVFGTISIVSLMISYVSSRLSVKQ